MPDVLYGLPAKEKHRQKYAVDCKGIVDLIFSLILNSGLSCLIFLKILCDYF